MVLCGLKSSEKKYYPDYARQFMEHFREIPGKLSLHVCKGREDDYVGEKHYLSDGGVCSTCFDGFVGRS